MTALINRVEKLIEYLMAAALAVMFVAVFGNVILRYVFGSGIAASEELSRLLFVWLIFLGAVLATGRHIHIGFDLAQRALPAPLRKLCMIVSHGLMLYALWLFWQGSWHQYQIGWRITSTVMKYPLALMAGAGLVAALGMALYIFANLVRALTGSSKAYIPGESHPFHADEETH
ncbi:TRAP transporter small permease [Pokkaliibacter sp. MBI-7]|uniref:TRAP transporter small permease protein n=1 Tax=Proteobacteria bacterium 228 TaxID=2083153 RepID=A0A2S5KIX6_9PROT|nr:MULTISPECIES: TRAP transporter small permease [Pokkaliibacter]MDH2432120.1 TRAP transporter small permease [Pokkaliibacter sp. MBI-7]PPC74469.1 TRAP transporter small permease [Pokkaliibacter plantistimulans]